MLVIENVTFYKATFYKAIVIAVDLFESQIVDERHFKTEDEAENFKRDIVKSPDNTVCIVCRIKN